MSGLIVKPITGGDDLRPMMRAAEAAGHRVIAPTHAWRRGNDIVGYASVAKLAFIGGWADKSVSADERRDGLQFAGALARAFGHRFAVMACPPDCDFLPVAEPAGFLRGKDSTMFIKLL